METEQFMAEYYSALQVQSAADIAVRMLEMRIKLGDLADSKTENQLFLEGTRDLEDDEIDFLANETVGLKELTEYLPWDGRAKTDRWLKRNGIEKRKPNGSKTIQVSTTAVIKAMRDGA